MFNKKKAITPIFIIRIIIVLLIIAVLAFLGLKIYEYTSDKYKMTQYPLTYSGYVEKYSSEFGVDADLIYSVIKVESNFKPSAVSNVGARGLMQIMEDTFDWIKYRLGEETPVYEDMFDEETNIRYGVYLLSYNLNYFNSDLTCAIAAYHAGTSGVESWLGEKKYSIDGKTLISIPSSDTEHYVNKVKKAYKIYAELYSVQNN